MEKQSYFLTEFRCSSIYSCISNFDNCLTDSMTRRYLLLNVKITLTIQTNENKSLLLFHIISNSKSKKMFGRKKTKLDVSLPKPPTKAEILEDLSTFSIDRTVFDAIKRRTSTTSTGATASITESSKVAGIEQDVHLENWWNKFETFLSEVDDLENFQKQFDAKRNTLEKLDSTIRVMSDDVRTQIGKSVQSALDEAADDNGSDLK